MTIFVPAQTNPACGRSCPPEPRAYGPVNRERSREESIATKRAPLQAYAPTRTLARHLPYATPRCCPWRTIQDRNPPTLHQFRAYPNRFEKTTRQFDPRYLKSDLN